MKLALVVASFLRWQNIKTSVEIGFAFVSAKAVLVRRIDKSKMNIKEWLPCVKGADAEGG